MVCRTWEEKEVFHRKKTKWLLQSDSILNIRKKTGGKKGKNEQETNKGSEGVRKTLCVSSQAHGYVTSPIRFASVRGSPVSRLDQGGPTNAALKHFNLPTSTTHGTTRPLSFSAGFCRIFLRPLPLGHKPLPPSCTDCSNLPVSRDVAFHPVSPLLLPPNPSPLGCTFQHPQHDRLWQPTNGRPSRCCHTLRVFQCSTRGTNIYRDTFTERLCDAFFFFHRFSPMGPINELQRCSSRVWSQGIYPALPGSRLRVFIAMQVQHSYTSSTNS